MEEYSATSEAHPAGCCDICGDPGYIDTIVTCTGCKVSREHLYCMRICRLDYPKEWYCEDCERRNEKVSPNSGMREEFAQESAVSTHKKLHQDSTQSNKPPNDSRWNFMDRKKKIVSGKTKPLSAEEVIMLSSGAKTHVSPVKRIVRSNSVLWKNAAAPVKSRDVHFKPSSQLVKANSALGPAPSKHFKPHRPTSSQINFVAQRQVQQSFKGLKGNNVTEEIKLEKEKCEPGFPSTPFIHGQQIVRAELQRNTSSVSHSADPSLDASWNGSFKVFNAFKQWEISDEIQAHPPSRVLRKVYEFSKLMPQVLQFELVPRWDLWVDIFQQFCLDKRDVGLYFFPRNRQRWENYVNLLHFMESEDLAMRTRVEGMELLIFTSKLLSMDCRTWGGRHFLWGVFKKEAKYASEVNANEYHTELDSNEVEMDIDMIGGEDVVGRVDIAVSKESLMPTQPDMMIDKEMDALGGKDVGKMDIVLSKQSLQPPPPPPPLNVTTGLHNDFPPGFEEVHRQRIQNSCSNKIGQKHRETV